MLAAARAAVPIVEFSLPYYFAFITAPPAARPGARSVPVLLRSRTGPGGDAARHRAAPGRRLGLRCRVARAAWRRCVGRERDGARARPPGPGTLGLATGKREKLLTGVDQVFVVWTSKSGLNPMGLVFL